MNTSKANTSKPWMTDEWYDIPFIENEEYWSQRVIDEMMVEIERLEEEKNDRKE